VTRSGPRQRWYRYWRRGHGAAETADDAEADVGGTAAVAADDAEADVGGTAAVAADDAEAAAGGHAPAAGEGPREPRPRLDDAMFHVEHRADPVAPSPTRDLRRTGPNTTPSADVQTRAGGSGLPPDLRDEASAPSDSVSSTTGATGDEAPRPPVGGAAETGDGGAAGSGGRSDSPPVFHVEPGPRERPGRPSEGPVAPAAGGPVDEGAVEAPQPGGAGRMRGADAGSMADGRRTRHDADIEDEERVRRQHASGTESAAATRDLAEARSLAESRGRAEARGRADADSTPDPGAGDEAGLPRADDDRTTEASPAPPSRFHVEPERRPSGAAEDATAHPEGTTAAPPPPQAPAAARPGGYSLARRFDRARVVTIANQKGGVGKTTTAVSLAAAMADLGFRTLLVDLDPQGNATSGVGVRARPGQPTVYDVLISDAAVEDAIEATSVRNLFVVPSTLDLAGAEIELVSVFSREQRLRRALEAIRPDYDLVFIDCPPSLGLLTVNALTAGDGVLVPIQCEYYALEGLGSLRRNADLIRSQLNPNLDIIGFVLTMLDARTRLSQQVVDEVRAHFGDRVFETRIPRTVRLAEAPGFRQPVTVFDPGSRGAQAYRRLADELAQRLTTIGGTTDAGPHDPAPTTPHGGSA
jgi:chromosome partitioning protein